MLENIQSFIETLAKEDQAKADAFKSAVMVLASPNSIGLASNEDIHISADGQISHTAGDSINISTQKSLIGHASKKISLFAAQEGARLYAGKGKIEIQAQGDAIDLIARKGVQIISTEDIIEFKSPKEIILTAGGSQLKINGSGIFSTTGGKFEVKAGQHLFKDGQNVENNVRQFLEPYSHQIQLLDEKNIPLGKNTPYYIYDENEEKEFYGRTDVKGKTMRIFTKNKNQLNVKVGKEAKDYLLKKGVDI